MAQAAWPGGRRGQSQCGSCRGDSVEHRRDRDGPEHVRGQPRPWTEDDPWIGWWGDNPPFHTPVFVLTHHPREPLEMEGGTTFTFVTDGIESALGHAKQAAHGQDVLLAGGANVVQQYLAAGLVDEFELHVVPIPLRDGERLLENVGEIKLEQVHAIDAPGVTHIKYRVIE